MSEERAGAAQQLAAQLTAHRSPDVAADEMFGQSATLTKRRVACGPFAGQTPLARLRPERYGLEVGGSNIVRRAAEVTTNGVFVEEANVAKDAMVWVNLLVSPNSSLNGYLRGLGAVAATSLRCLARLCNLRLL